MGYSLGAATRLSSTKTSAMLRPTFHGEHKRKRLRPWFISRRFSGAPEGSLCLQLLSRFYASSFAAASCLADLFEISRRRKWPFHIQSPERSSTGRKKDIPNTGGVVVSIRRRIINVTEYRNATDDVNPAKN